MTTLSLEIPLPSSFRPGGVLHYYGRDRSERRRKRGMIVLKNHFGFVTHQHTFWFVSGA